MYRYPEVGRVADPRISACQRCASSAESPPSMRVGTQTGPACAGHRRFTLPIRFAQVKKRSPSANKRQTHDDHNPPLSARQATPSARQATPSLVEVRRAARRGASKPGDPTVSATTTDTLDLMRVATWNVNSVKQRIPRLLPWLDQRQPDVVCLQETKLTDDAFAELFAEPLAERGIAPEDETYRGVSAGARFSPAIVTWRGVEMRHY